MKMTKPEQNKYAKEQHEIEYEKLKNKVTIMYFIMTFWLLLTIGYVSLYLVGVR